MANGLLFLKPKFPSCSNPINDKLAMRVASLISCLLLLFAAPPSRAWTDEFPAPVNTEKATDGPMSPEDVCNNSKLPPGFELTVFAAEPAVQNPIAITLDERGRLWVAENYSWAGANGGGFDPNARDRVVILEDTDGDGKHDKRTVFWDGAHKLTSVEVGFGGVWVLCAPQMLFIPDKNRDDVPDGPPVVVLDGFVEGSVLHNTANGLKWGPDGWLYARHGILATSNIGKPGASDSQRVKINTGIWRYHPTRGVVEAVMHGMANSWGFDFDEHGEMFCINTVIGHLWHVVPGAHVQRMYGVDLNPHAYQLIEQTADHVHWDTGEQWNAVNKGVTDKTSAAGGGHAHVGLLIYQGDNWPQEYRGKAYTLNMHGRRINCDRLEREGAGYVARHDKDFAFFADPWFRGMDLITGPDGGVFIADWSDAGECHDHDGVHRTSGRIYKLTYGTPKQVASRDLANFHNEASMGTKITENDWWNRQVRRIIQQAKALGRPAEFTSDLDTPFSSNSFFMPKKPVIDRETDALQKLRRFWRLVANGDNNPRWLFKQLAEPDEHLRAWALRTLLDNVSPDGPQLAPALQDSLNQFADKETSGLVQLYLASSLQRLSIDLRWPIAEALASKKAFANDRMLPLMIWYGIEPAVARNPAKALAMLKQAQIPLVRQNTARRLMLEIERQPDSIDHLVALATSAGDPTLARDLVVGMAEALKGWRKATAPKAWNALAVTMATSPYDDAKNAARDLNIVFGDGRALDELRAVVVNGGAEPESRRQSLRALLTGKPDDLAPVLHNLLGDPAVAIDAIRGLALYDHPDTPARLLGAMASYASAARAEVINTLTVRPTYAKALLQALRDKTITASEVSAFNARQIRSFENEELTRQLTELWGDVRVSAAEKRSLIDHYKSELTSEVLAKANLSAGREMFQKTCANCHVLYGVGRHVGPDLTGSNRRNIDYLLENIVDPSASVGVDFRVLAVALDDGRVLSGVVSEQNERTLTLQTPQEAVTIDRQEIAESQQSNNSLMPDGQLQNLTADQIRDLVGYLMSTDQVPLPLRSE